MAEAATVAETWSHFGMLLGSFLDHFGIIFKSLLVIFLKYFQIFPIILYTPYFFQKRSNEILSQGPKCPTGPNCKRGACGGGEPPR